MVVLPQQTEVKSAPPPKPTEEPTDSKGIQGIFKIVDDQQQELMHNISEVAAEKPATPVEDDPEIITSPNKSRKSSITSPTKSGASPNKCGEGDKSGRTSANVSRKQSVSAESAGGKSSSRPSSRISQTSGSRANSRVEDEAPTEEQVIF